MRPNVNKKKLFAMLGVVAAVVIAAAVFMTIRRNYEPGYLNSIFQMKNENMPLFLQYAYMYIANNYSNFNCLTQALQQGLVEHTFGLKQLFPVFALTGLKFVFPALVAFEMPVTIKELNTLTLIYDAYYDFGLIGVFFIWLDSWCCLCSTHNKKSEKTVNPIFVFVLRTACTVFSIVVLLVVVYRANHMVLVCIDGGTLFICKKVDLQKSYIVVS